MRSISRVLHASVALATLLSFTSAGRAQTACKRIDDPAPGAAAVAPRALEAFRTATPEALRAFRELNVNPPRGKIVGGWETSIENNPWQIAMIRAAIAEPRRSQFCGGSIISNNWILTAAHCVRNSIVREDPTRVEIIAGSPQWAIGGERLKVAAIHVHPQYNDSTMDHDFALLRLQSPVTTAQPIRLAGAQARVETGAKACVSGWGATFEGGPGAIDLLGVEVPVVANEVCNRPESYNGDITAAMMCAGREEGLADSCQGDSGGPFSTVIDGQPTLIGVVSWGEGCARRLKYGVYARVSAAAAWIATTTDAATGGGR